MVYLDADGHQRYTKGVDEKLVARQRRGPAPGKAMYIEGGRHSGFFCTVRCVPGCCLSTRGLFLEQQQPPQSYCVCNA